MYLVNDYNKMLQDNKPLTPALDNTNGAILLRRGLLGVLLVLAVMFVIVAARSAGAPVNLDWLSRMAHAGEPDAQLQLALAYRDGRYGLAQDPKTGLYWMQQAASHANSYAEDAVGVAYARGQGTSQDPQLASQWLRKAIHDGNRQARVHLSEVLVQTGHLHQAEQLLL